MQRVCTRTRHVLTGRSRGGCRRRRNKDHAPERSCGLRAVCGAYSMQRGARLSRVPPLGSHSAHSTRCRSSRAPAALSLPQCCVLYAARCMLLYDVTWRTTLGGHRDPGLIGLLGSHISEKARPRTQMHAHAPQHAGATCTRTRAHSRARAQLGASHCALDCHRQRRRSVLASSRTASTRRRPECTPHCKTVGQTCTWY